jgi:phage regulator Rha-like protein
MKNKNANEIKIIEKNFNGIPEKVVSSSQISEGTKYKHKVVMNLIRNHKSTLEKYGVLHFENAKPNSSLGGRPEIITFLNEQQCTLLLTFMRNNNIVKSFKIQLVESFYKLRDLAINQNSTSITELLNNPKKLLEIVKIQTEKVLILQPKAQAFERIAEKTSGSKSITDSAKELNLSPK